MNEREGKGFKWPAFLSSPRFRKRLRKILITLLILGALVGGAGIFIEYFYEDTVKSIIISQLNERLNCKINVKEIEFSIFRKFPYASVHFMEATVYDAYRDTSTIETDQHHKKKKKFTKPDFQDSILLKAQDVYLQMSIWDLIFGEYRIKRVEVDDASLQLKVFSDGSNNWDILKPSQDSTETSDFSFDLQKLILKKVACSYEDLPARQDYKLLARDVMLKGAFSSDNYQLDIYGDMAVYRIKSKGENYFNSPNTKIDMSMDVNQKEETVTFTSGELNVGGLPLKVLGYVAYGDTREELDLDIQGNGLPLQSFLEELPQTWKRYIDTYEGKGRFNFNAKVSGTWADDQIPLFTASFSLDKGEISQKETGITLTDVGVKASYTNGKAHNNSTAVLDLSSFSARLKLGSIQGSFHMQDFNKPLVKLIAEGNLDLAELQEFVKSDTLSAMSGNLAFNVSYEGQLQSNRNFLASDFVQSKSSGTMKLSNGNFEFRGQQLRFTGLNGNFRFSNNDVISDDFSGKIGRSDFSLKGYFRNVLSYVFLKGEALQINADLTSQLIDMDDLLQYQANSGDTTSLRMNISPKLEVNFNLKSRAFNFGKFTASNIIGEVKIRNSQLLVKNLSFGAMDGRVNVTGLIDGSQAGKLLISCDASIYQVDIKKMFYQFNNFGQKHLREEHLKGLVTANIKFGSVWSNTFEIDLSTIYALAEITIENGELIHFAPIEGLEDQLKKRDFSDIKFATLKTQVSIKDKIITIPNTTIRNDVMDVDISGTHGFDNQIDYHVSVLYSELFNRDKNKQTQFGQVEDDGLHSERYFFRITGTTENPVYIKMDKTAYKENIKQKVQTEKQNLKDILNQEFKWFKKDTVKVKDPNKKPKDKEGDGEFNLEWEED